jgi:betaine-homocysteine S-methyltransferase
MESSITKQPSLLQRLENGPVICAEGYLFELERRGYLQAGAFVPEVVLEHPEAVTQLHRDFVHAGSDVVEALTYYAHREKLRIIGREQDLEPINLKALALAKAVARETGSLFAGDICNTNVYDPADPASHKAIRAMFEEQVGWAADAGVDFIIGETFSYAAEARKLDRGRGMPPNRRRRRRCRRPQLHPRPGDAAAAASAGARRCVDSGRGPSGALPH